MYDHIRQLTEDIAAKLEIELDQEQLQQLSLYVEKLLDSQTGVRLTGETTAEKILYKQVYDSIYPVKVFHFKRGCRIIDVGSGGGLPGIPLKICLPHVSLTMLDANKKKTEALKKITSTIGLENTLCINARVEDFAREADHRESYDYSISKAVADMNVLAEYTLPLIKVGGAAVYFKGPKGQDELEKACGAIETCGGRYREVFHYSLTGGEKRTLFIIDKVSTTPDKYPRRPGIPAKRPII